MGAAAAHMFSQSFNPYSFLPALIGLTIFVNGLLISTPELPKANPPLKGVAIHRSMRQG